MPCTPLLKIVQTQVSKREKEETEIVREKRVSSRKDERVTRDSSGRKCSCVKDGIHFMTET